LQSFFESFIVGRKGAKKMSREEKGKICNPKLDLPESENVFHFNIEEELKKLPEKPGVYLMHDETDAIIYVGKAVVLKNRVRQYFQSGRGKSPKILQMVSQIRRFEYIVTDSELEALVLECNLIKEHRPKYNTMLTDDKTYPYIKVTLQEAYPRVILTRRLKKDKAKYFGPYTSVGAVRDTLELLRKLYRLRNCRRTLPRDTGKERPCLYYHIHQCAAPCQGYISQAEYGVQLEKAMAFLNGNYKEVLSELKGKMETASAAMEFEKAAEYRDLLVSVQAVAQKQKITNTDGEDKDILAVAMDEEDAIVQAFFIRGGKMLGREHYHVQLGNGETKGQILTAFLKQFYGGNPVLPREIMLPQAVEEQEILEQWLSEKKGQRVYLRVPQRGSKEKLVELAAKNAEMVLKQDKEKIKREEGRTIGALKELADCLGIEKLVRIEAFDISNISGFNSVGSMVVYEKGKPKTADYRKFRIRSVEGANDYASMEEVLSRRFRHGMEERQQREESRQDVELGSFTRFPDLIMMDGGKGQVQIALQVLEKLGLQIPVCGMVKDDHHRTRGLYYLGEEISMDTHGEGFRLITRIQDEAHRFAIEYHRSLRSKGQVHSVLDDISGVGPVRRKALMARYGSLEEMKQASAEELAQVPGFNRSAAQKVYEFLHSAES
jgi:excinuclease ABC subunit C